MKLIAKFLALLLLLLVGAYTRPRRVGIAPTAPAQSALPGHWTGFDFPAAATAGATEGRAVADARNLTARVSK